MICLCPIGLYASKKNKEENIVQQQFDQAESSSKILYSTEGQPICKITHSKQGNSILTFNAKFSKTKLILYKLF